MYKKHILWKRGSGDIKIPEEGSKDKKTELTHMERTNSYFTNSEIFTIVGISKVEHR